MKISHPDVKDISPSLETQPVNHQAANLDDVDFFSAALENPDISHAHNAVRQGPDALFNKVSSMFNQFDEDKKDMNMALRKASRSIDPLTLTKVDGKLSNYYLESSLNAKIVSKTVQGLEKLTNLQ